MERQLSLYEEKMQSTHFRLTFSFLMGASPSAAMVMTEGEFVGMLEDSDEAQSAYRNQDARRSWA